MFGFPFKRLPWADREAQVVEYLPSKCKALISNPSTAKKQNKTKQKKPKKHNLNLFLKIHYLFITTLNIIGFQSYSKRIPVSGY
jgi:hypothetical protein